MSQSTEMLKPSPSNPATLPDREATVASVTPPPPLKPPSESVWPTTLTAALDPFGSVDALAAKLSSPL